MFAPSVAPAERRPAAPREEIDGKGGGEKAIKTRRRRERERRGLPSEERKRKAQERKPTKPSFNAEVATGDGSGGGAPLFSASATWLPTPWPPVAPGAAAATAAVHRCQ